MIFVVFDLSSIIVSINCSFFTFIWPYCGLVCCACGRSLCSLVCKWLFEADSSKRGWNKEFMSDIGLADLALDGFRKIGKVKNFQLRLD